MRPGKKSQRRMTKTVSKQKYFHVGVKVFFCRSKTFFVFFITCLYLLQRLIKIKVSRCSTRLSQFVGKNGLAMSPMVSATWEPNSQVSMVMQFSFNPMVCVGELNSWVSIVLLSV
jgi:hypothetical protein